MKRAALQISNSSSTLSELEFGGRTQNQQDQSPHAGGHDFRFSPHDHRVWKVHDHDINATSIENFNPKKCCQLNSSLVYAE